MTMTSTQISQELLRSKQQEKQFVQMHETDGTDGT